MQMIQGALLMFKIIVADGKQELPEDDIYYIVAKEGIYIKKKLGIMDSVSPVKNISILESVQATAKMNIEKIPAIAVAKIANFFRAIQEQHGSEAIVILFYNEETKKYKLVPPSQKVTPGGIEYNRSIVIDGWTMIGDIHSHSSMSAFHSGTDQGDENSFDGLHITFGNMNCELISISASIVSNGNRVMIKPEEYMKGIELKQDVDEVEKIPTRRVYKWVDGKMIEETPNYKTKGFKTVRKYDKRYKILSEGAIKSKVPDAWLSKVQYGITHRYGNSILDKVWQNYYSGGQWARGRWTGHNSRGWNEHFDPGVWNNKDKISKPNEPPQNVGVKTKPIKFPPHKQGPHITDVTPPENPIPCESCAFKERAPEFVAKLLVEENDGVIQEETNWPSWLEKETYECEKCNIIVTFNYNDQGEIEDEILCPSCNSSDNLTMIDMDDDIHNSSEPEIDGRISCKTCGSAFDSTMLQKDNAGGSCPFCGTLILPKENLESISEKDIAEYHAEKENPDPSNMIPDPDQNINKRKANPLEWMFEKFGRIL
jgi:PRTRC genetic system protein A